MSAVAVAATPPVAVPPRSGEPLADAAGDPTASVPGIEGSEGSATKLFIGGISRRTTTKQLKDHFSKHGHVLDCVAMRQADGRPRGFGYVTLDSTEAAERVLGQPQVIDGRVVDLKLAVPDVGSDGAEGASVTKRKKHKAKKEQPAQDAAVVPA
eukprot:CAMPEP_0170277414 /NCGR_PEP_ID=MMETSP0116_2-20130129/38699_1 /TAXON_ID=400756 /ORGANISM="Durinskia baltica, Strain CSIRO CS-38" /LENGTH=153 /DNA_ID=CAMNT_0010528701 /DNA_START=30 /DNA_END=488 /DNA_ORIENTATION=+